MKLHLLHGLGISASRRKLTDIKSQFDSDNVIVFENSVNPDLVISSLSTPSLFLQEQLIIWENPPEDFTCHLSPVTCHLVLWFDHKLKESSKILKWIKEQKEEVLNFEEGKEISVFPLLDLFANKDKKAFLEIRKLKNSGYEIYYFLTMVLYLLRNLAATPKNAPPFVRQKLERQRKNFTIEEIKNLYRNILEIDFKIKSGLLEKEQAEFLLVNLFVG